MKEFFDLLLIAIGKKENLDRQLSREEWEELYSLSRKQSLLGVLRPALDIIPREFGAPLPVYSRWVLVSENIRARNKLHQKRCAEITRTFLDMGYRCCILKGCSAATRYPDSLLRQGGDIDVWVEAPREEIVSRLRSLYPTGKVLYIHIDVKMFDDVSVEVHFTPGWLNSPKYNSRLQEWFSRTSDEQFSRYDKGFCSPSPRFDGVYMLCHVFRHLMEEGVGLRQVLDYYYLALVLDEDDREYVRTEVKALGLLKFTGALMYVLKTVFLLEDKYLICSPDSKEGSFLLDEIMEAGNFGKYDPRIERKPSSGRVHHVKSKLGRSLRFLTHYPSEVLSIPYFMLWQYFWRRRNGYLYNGK